MKKKIQISDIVLWVLFAVTVVVAILFFAGEQQEYALSTQGTIFASSNIDPYLYWTYAVVLIGVVLLVIFAVKTLITMFQTDAKGAIGTLGSFVLFALLLVVCYFLSGETEYNKIVNGENVHYSEGTMKMIDMWIYSIYALIGITVLLVVGFGVKNLIKK